MPGGHSQWLARQTRQTRVELAKENWLSRIRTWINGSKVRPLRSELTHNSLDICRLAVNIRTYVRRDTGGLPPNLTQDLTHLRIPTRVSPDSPLFESRVDPLGKSAGTPRGAGDYLPKTRSGSNHRIGSSSKSARKSACPLYGFDYLGAAPKPQSLRQKHSAFAGRPQLPRKQLSDLIRA
jgi:hypothetical protein